MKRHLIRAALAALVVPASVMLVGSFGTARADATAVPDQSAASALLGPAPVVLGARAGDALVPVGAQTASDFTVASGTASSPFLGDGDDAAPFASATLASTRYEATRYRPRRERYREGRSYRARGVSQLHVGFLDPEGTADPGFVVGFRGGQQIDDIFQLGLGVDWRNKSGRATEVSQETIGPGGEVIRVSRDLSRYSSNLFPALAYLQLSGPSDLGIVPYFGAAASWQVLFLEAEDFQTGQTFDATFDGFGWQLWGGAAMPLSGRSKLVGEVFLNDADLSRDVFDSTTGTTIREIVSTDGIGARFGISWGF